MSATYSILQQVRRTVGLSLCSCLRLAKVGALQNRSIARTLSLLTAHGQRDGQRTESHEDAVLKLADLQTNQSIITQTASAGFNWQLQESKLAELHKRLNRVNITNEDLNNLNVIHITGTKGKGSTAALTDSILRQHGYKTGFYSSPHLVDVTERIRLDGAPIAKDLFAKYFWQIHDELYEQLQPGETLPFYFHFLTIVAFRAFIKEKVDVAIIEVGIGGRYDCTNAMSEPICTAVTSLALDHTNILGNSIEDIAWHKAGIFKPGCPAVTINQSDTSANDMLMKCSSEVGCPLYLAPPINAQIGIDGDIQQVNAGIAVQLCSIFMDRMGDRHQWTQPPLEEKPLTLPLVPIDVYFQEGLSQCKWPGRYHRVERERVTYYFDGAHTAESVTLAFQWFKAEADKERAELKRQGRQVLTVLLFNKTGQRLASELLQPLTAYNFDYALFSSNLIASADADHVPDRRISIDEQMAVGEKNKDSWTRLQHNSLQSQSDDGAITHTFPTLSSAIAWVGRDPSPLEHSVTDYPRVSLDTHLQVFATGSLYLVGNSLSVLAEPIC